MSALSRDLFGNIGLVSVRVLRGSLCVGTYALRSGDCLYVFGEVGLV